MTKRDGPTAMVQLTCRGCNHFDEALDACGLRCETSSDFNIDTHPVEWRGKVCPYLPEGPLFAVELPPQDLEKSWEDCRNWVIQNALKRDDVM